MRKYVKTILKDKVQLDILMQKLEVYLQVDKYQE